MSNVSDPFSILNTGQVKRAEPVPKAKRYWVKKIEEEKFSSSSESDSEEEENLTEEQKKIKQMEKEKKKQEKIKRKQEILAKKQKAKKQNDDIFSDLEEEDEDEEDNVFKQITKNQNQNNNESQNQEQNNGQPKRRVIQATIIQQTEEKQTEIVERPARRRVIQSAQIISTDQNNDGDKKENEENQNKEVEVKIKQTEEIDVSSRRQRLARRRMEEEEEEEEELDEIQEIQRKKQIQNQNQNKNQSNEENQNEQEEQDNKVQIIGKSLTVPSKESQVIRNRKEKIEQEEEEESDEGEESDESDYADDYADEDETRNIQKMLKPVFLTAAERQKRDLKEEEERRLKEEKWKNQERILQETKNMVVKELAKGENEDELNEEGEQMPDDDDDIDKEKEAEQWKIRELKRIKRDRDERLKYQKLQQEVERRRNLTEEQRIQEDLEKEKKNPKKEKTKYVFMQKYYHKGAFYQGDEEDDPNSILNRDFNVAVGEELFDKSQLRNFQQKRRGMYGVKGQSKYTHLTDQDTTNYDPSFKVDENIQQKMFQKYAGFKNANVLERKQLKRKI